MADGTFNPSRCEITRAELIPFDKEGNSKPIDIRDMIGAFNFSQSIVSTALTGSVVVLDNIGLLDNFEIRAEEQLKLEVYCYDLQTKLKLNCQVYKIDGVDISTNIKGMTYDIHWMAKVSFEAAKRSIITAFINKPASRMVEDIFKKYYSEISEVAVPEQLPVGTKVYSIKNDPGRRFYVEQTKKNMSLTIPDYMPSQAITFICKRTISSERSETSPLFRFFENYNGFYFVSDEWLYEYAELNKSLIKKMNYSPYVELDGATPREQIDTFTAFTNSSHVDVGSELNDGYYNTTIVEVDILRRTAKRENYDYLKEFKKFTGSGGKKLEKLDTDPHTEDFIKQTFTNENAKQMMIIRDWSEKNSGAFRPNARMRELAARRNMFMNHAGSTACEAATTGRLDIQAGDVVDLNMKEANDGNQKNQNKRLSGRYLVISSQQLVQGGQLTTSLQLSKYGFTDAGFDKRKNTQKAVANR